MNSRTAAPSRSSATCRGRRSPLPLDLQRRNALVEAHRHLVPPLAGHYWLRCQEPRDDLTQVGLLGLIRAAELYRHSLQTPFAAFARPHIRGAILHYLRDGAPSVRLPRRQSELRIRLARLEETMTPGCGNRRAAETELRNRLGMTQEQWRLLQRHRQLCRPTPLEGDLLEHVATPEEDPREVDDERLTRVEELLAGLDGRSQQVLRWVVVRGWSYRKAAAALGVSVMTVQRCLHKGLATLREQLQEGPRPLSPGGRVGRAPSVARGWPSRHSPPPAAAPARLSRP
jgi:RNA polymerase sigma-B factor